MMKKACFWAVSLALLMLTLGCKKAQGQERVARDDAPALAMTGHEGLNVVILGDSNSSIGGDDCDQPRGWTKWFKERFAPATCKSYARSGATWTNTPQTRRNVKENIGKLGNDNVVYNQICRLEEACRNGLQPSPHLIIISAGTNDAWFHDQRPQAFSMTAEEAFNPSDRFITDREARTVLSLAASVRYGCEMLMERFPDAQIVLLTPLQTTAAPYNLIRQAGDIIEACADRMCIGTVRLDKLGSVYDVRERRQKTYTYDGTHTSEQGARRNGYMVAAQVNAMR